ncbi:SPFH domain-containing protein [Priestia flexa]|uniref:SPFH domain-containing protein n=1 Tax=Priestia flexa TaxID=86664 RepID=UPI0004731F20|nr:SPFH domain-containing protein [Priestia flexa]
MTKTKAIIGGAVLGTGLLVGGVLTAMSVEVIGQGSAGVVYSRSEGVQDKTLGQGWHLVSPFEKVTSYPISTETVNGADFNVQTKDGKPLTVSLSYDYANDLEKLPHIYNKFKGQDSETIQNGWLQTRIKKAALNVFAKYSVLEVFQNQGQINSEIENEFRKLVDKEGFLVDSVTLSAPSPDKQTAQAIQGVVDAQQKLEKLEIEKKQAEAKAEKLKIEAQGKAEAAIIKAKSEAEANKTLNASLTPELLEMKRIEKWDGDKNVQTKVVGSDSNVIVGGSK